MPPGLCQREHVTPPCSLLPKATTQPSSWTQGEEEKLAHEACTSKRKPISKPNDPPSTPSTKRAAEFRRRKKSFVAFFPQKIKGHVPLAQGEGARCGRAARVWCFIIVSGRPPSIPAPPFCFTIVRRWRREGGKEGEMALGKALPPPHTHNPLSLSLSSPAGGNPSRL